MSGPMPPQGDIMIQSPFQHQSPHGNSPHQQGSQSHSSSRPDISQSASYGGSGGRGSKGGGSNSPVQQQQQNSPPGGVYGSHPGNGHYMGHVPSMQSPPQPYGSSGNGNGHHGGPPPPHHYPVHPMYGQYPPPPSGYPYHPHMPPHGWPQQQQQQQQQHHRQPYGDGGSNNGSGVPKSNDVRDGDNRPDERDDAAPLATAVSSRKTNHSNNHKDGGGGPYGSSPTPTSEDGRPSAAVDAVSNVEHMKHDFHFYVRDVSDKLTEEATEWLRKRGDTRPESVDDEELRRIDDDDGVHPYLLFTNVNERLVAGWEKMPQSKRSEYLVKEEEDRRRFQSAEEVASRHCATLTARARSPQAFSGRNRDSSARKFKDAADARRSPSPTADAPASSITAALQSEGDQHQHQNDDEDTAVVVVDNNVGKTRTADRMDGEAPQESPTKRNRVDVSSSSNNDDANEFPSSRDERTSDVDNNDKDNNNNDTAPPETTTDGRSKDLAAAAADSDGSCDDDDQEAMEVEALLDRRVRQVRGKKIKEYLVRWKGLGEDSNSWEPLKNVEHCEDMIRTVDDRKRQEKERTTTTTTSSTGGTVTEKTNVPAVVGGQPTPTRP